MPVRDIKGLGRAPIVGLAALATVIAVVASGCVVAKDEFQATDPWDVENFGGQVYWTTQGGGAQLFQGDPATGTVTLLAGNGQGVADSNPRDGQPALSVPFTNLAGVAIAPGGQHLYFADAQRNRIRILDLATGILSSVIAPPGSRVNSDGSLQGEVDLSFGPDGSLFVVYPDGVGRILPDGSWTFYGGFAPSLIRILVAGTKLYVADYTGHQLFVVDLTTNQTTLVAGTGDAGASGDGGPATQATLLFPESMVLDPTGRLVFVQDNPPSEGGSRLRRIDPATGIITTIYDPGFVMHGLSIDSSGTLWASSDSAPRFEILALTVTG
jgi:DNA-binding beta-propeller fold protein YncE